MKDVERANCAASLGCIVERGLQPLVWHIDVEMLLGAKARDCLNWVNLTRNCPLFDLDEGVVKRYSAKIVPGIDIDSKIDQELLNLKCRVCGST